MKVPLVMNYLEKDKIKFYSYKEALLLEENKKNIPLL
jgi:hypothetical protein